MRALLALFGMPLGVTLLVGSLWWSPPWGVSLRLEPRPVAAPHGPGAGGRVLQAAMSRSIAGLDGIALGDHVQFDRYGVLAPVAGRVLCVWLPPGSRPLTLTSLGGVFDEATAVHLTESTLADCPVAARP